MTDKNSPLTDKEVIRSYRDAEFRESLTQEQMIYASNHALQPDDYSGDGELSDEDLETVSGGGISSGSCCSFCNQH